MLEPLLIFSDSSRIRRWEVPVPLPDVRDMVSGLSILLGARRLPLLLTLPLLSALNWPVADFEDEDNAPPRLRDREDCDRASIDNKVALENRSSLGGSCVCDWW